MSTSAAPWLDGLDEGWTQPSASPKVTDAGNNNLGSLRQSRIPRRSVGGLSSSVANRKSSGPSNIAPRKPLSALSNGTTNSTRTTRASFKQSASRSVSAASNDSVIHNGTVQVQARAKSESPGKKQETLEWKKRLLQGQVAYRDQTDLFGPSALENIFNRSDVVDVAAPARKSRMGWLAGSDQPMPSSPPPWPSNDSSQLEAEEVQAGDESLPAVDNVEVSDESESRGNDADISRQSEPFDLQCTTDEGEPAGDDSVYTEGDAVATLRNGGVGNRTISGPTMLEQEDFSPVFISKHTQQNGQIGYAAYDPRLAEELASSQKQLQDQRDEDSDDRSTFTDGPQSDSILPPPDLSLSENLETGTPPVTGLRRHVQLQRGGYSMYDSFKHRPLSRSPSRASEEPQQQYAATRLSPIPQSPDKLPAAPSPPPAPSTPVRPPTAETRLKPSGSPLKLFGPHDTFTNHRLLRRMSQLDGELDLPSDAQLEDTKPRNTSFGSGELNNHVFNAEITITSASDSENSFSYGSPASEILVPGSRDPHAFRFDEVQHQTSSFGLKRRLSKHSTLTSKTSTMQRHTSNYFAANAAHGGGSSPEVKISTRAHENGKRPPNSPFKDPTPKRRRTLHESELEDVREMNDAYNMSLQEASALPRKRKDSRHGGFLINADPNTLAKRKIIRPRNPTPSQDRQSQLQLELKEATEEYAAHHASQLESVIEQVENSYSSDTAPTLQQQAEAVASEVAAFTLRVSKPSAEHGGRKPSVTTQDFLNEAMMVMNLIRAKARPNSGLGSVEESEGEALQHDGSAEDDSEGSEPLRLSRPPSRDGQPSGWRPTLQAPTDVRVISHLRKFEEKDDTEFIAESIPSLHVPDEDAFDDDSVVIIDEHSNIRIHKPPVADPTVTDHLSQGSRGSTLQSYGSNGTSTGRTNATTSTRKSENVGTLAPDAVAHIIPELVGTMMYDKNKKTWVRAKTPVEQKSGFLEPPSHVESDEDPFREISDLPVDEQAEMRRISANMEARSIARDDAVEEIPTRTQHAAPPSQAQECAQRPVTRDTSHARPEYSSSVPSRYSALDSSQQEKAETRATSYNDEELARLSSFGKIRQQSLGYAAAQALLAFRTEQQTIPEEVDSEDLDSSQPDDSQLTAEEVEDILPQKQRENPVRRPHGPSVTFQSAPRQMSLRRKTLTNTLNVVEGREESELSLIATLPGERMMSLSLSVSRPAPKRDALATITALQSSPSKPDGSFYLSDLPDFTVHEDDQQQHPSEQKLAARLAKHAADEINDRYAVAVKDLVKTLTDVQDGEVFWEEVKHLDLQDRGIDSLYGLSDFCNRVQAMDVSNNSLRHLEGAPYCLRRLTARSNNLSSLTGWAHLGNLQTLDISGNQLTNLDGLKDLYHLREIIADDNLIENLDGISGLDALLKLRVRRNRLQVLDFDDTQLQQLTDLDCSSNQIRQVRHIEELASLSTLRLDNNPLLEGFEIAESMPRIRQLGLRNCHLGELDVSRLTHLRTLDVDRNRLSKIEGLHDLRHLEDLSMREQNLPKGVLVSIFDQPLEARTIRLSGNALPSLRLNASFLNVQHLELASTGLQELPDDFGLNMPNLRTLNLNFNFIKDIRPVLNVQKIEHLSVCGNRLSRLRKSIATLAKMTTLKSLDLRDNPVTQGFYCPAITAQTGLIQRQSVASATDEDDHENTMELAKHNLPNGDVEQDIGHQGRMDEGTKMRRRVYELLLANSCHNLYALDGLGFDRTQAAKKDGVFYRLVELGIVRKATHEAA